MKTKIAYCRWCNEEIGYEDETGMRYLNRIFHMRMKHPVRKAAADLLAPLTRGDPISFPIRWELNVANQ